MCSQPSSLAKKIFVSYFPTCSFRMGAPTLCIVDENIDILQQVPAEDASLSDIVIRNPCLGSCVPNHIFQQFVQDVNARYIIGPSDKFEGTGTQSLVSPTFQRQVVIHKVYHERIYVYTVHERVHAPPIAIVRP